MSTIDDIERIGTLLNQDGQSINSLYEAAAVTLTNRSIGALAEGISELTSQGLDPHEFVAKPPSVMKQHQRTMRLEAQLKQQAVKDEQDRLDREQQRQQAAEKHELEMEVLRLQKQALFNNAQPATV